ncbi:F-box domain-containing protein [Mycena kentingensis (nom. inval.)]|nr:F-box domain-containing protein [Mycena kentingensis (nom. inval.)]
MFAARRSLRQLATSSARLSSKQLLATSTLLPRATSSATRSFSVSTRVLKAGASDSALVSKLSEELKYERESNENADPDFLTSFKEQGVWQIKDLPGDCEVVLTRQFGNENIRVVFSVSDLQNQNPSEYEEEEAEGEREGEEDVGPTEVLRAVATITKPSASGALELDLSVQNGSFLVDNVTFYADSNLGHDTSVEADWKRRGLYVGPEFNTLDVTLQEEFEKFLEERDIGESLAFFIPDYAHHKEQKEYTKWLENVKTFVEA